MNEEQKKEPATEKQLKMLDDFGFDYSPKITKKAARNLINWAMAKRKKWLDENEPKHTIKLSDIIYYMQLICDDYKTSGTNDMYMEIRFYTDELIERLIELYGD